MNIITTFYWLGIGARISTRHKDIRGNQYLLVSCTQEMQFNGLERKKLNRDTNIEFTLRTFSLVNIIYGGQILLSRSN